MCTEEFPLSCIKGRKGDSLYRSMFIVCKQVTHVVWSRCQRGSLAALSWPDSSRVKANIFCKKSADTVEVWVRDCESLSGKRGKCPGNFVRLLRTSLELARFQLRSQRWWQEHPPTPVCLCVPPFAVLLSESCPSMARSLVRAEHVHKQVSKPGHFPPARRVESIFSHLLFLLTLSQLKHE